MGLRDIGGSINNISTRAHEGKPPQQAEVYYFLGRKAMHYTQRHQLYKCAHKYNAITTAGFQEFNKIIKHI